MSWTLGRPLEKGDCEVCTFRLGGKRKHVQARMSCVTRVMTRDVGVVSSHLQRRENYQHGPVPGHLEMHLRVVPRTDSISFRWIDLEALSAPNTYTPVPTVKAITATSKIRP